jgi:hypothetical protein
MISSRLRVIALIFAVAGTLGAAAASMQATPARCVSTPVPGQPGVHIVSCKTRS